MTVCVGEREVAKEAVLQPSTAPVLTHLLLLDAGQLCQDQNVGNRRHS